MRGMGGERRQETRGDAPSGGRLPSYRTGCANSHALRLAAQLPKILAAANFNMIDQKTLSIPLGAKHGMIGKYMAENMAMLMSSLGPQLCPTMNITPERFEKLRKACTQSWDTYNVHTNLYCVLGTPSKARNPPEVS